MSLTGLHELQRSERLWPRSSSYLSNGVRGLPLTVLSRLRLTVA